MVSLSVNNTFIMLADKVAAALFDKTLNGVITNFEQKNALNSAVLAAFKSLQTEWREDGPNHRLLRIDGRGALDEGFFIDNDVCQELYGKYFDFNNEFLPDDDSLWNIYEKMYPGEKQQIPKEDFKRTIYLFKEAFLAEAKQQPTLRSILTERGMFTLVETNIISSDGDAHQLIREYVSNVYKDKEDEIESYLSEAGHDEFNYVEPDIVYLEDHPNKPFVKTEKKFNWQHSLTAAEQLTIITGGGGIGKTAYLKWLEKEIISLFRESAWQERLPLYIHGSDFDDLGKETDKFDDKLAGMIEPYLEEKNKDRAKALIKFLRRKRRLIMLIDGFDQLNVDGALQVKHIITAPVFLKGSQVFLTVRPHRLSGIRKDNSTQVVEIEPFDEGLREKYFGSLLENNNFNNIIDNNIGLASIPLLAKMIKYLALEGYLENIGDNRFRLFELFIGKVCEIEAKHASAEEKREGKDKDYWLAQICPLLGQLAYDLMVAGKKEKFSKSDLIKILNKNNKFELKNDLTRGPILHLIDVEGPIPKVEDIKWHHQSFQEYFAACKLFHEYKEDKIKLLKSLSQLNYEDELANFFQEMMVEKTNDLEDDLDYWHGWLTKVKSDKAGTYALRFRDSLGERLPARIDYLFQAENQALLRRQRELAKKLNVPAEREGFILISTDKFIYGSYHYYHQIERPARLMEVAEIKSFYLAKYPVTNREFSEFVKAGGYANKDYWQAGWEWRQEANISEPAYWRDKEWNKPDYPVVGVSWYEAVAYANWKSETEGITDAAKKYRLPTEVEWEAAARGVNGRAYPWGSEFDENKCNTSKSVIGGTTPVNKYPDGRGPYGCCDMAGNVWEWCADWYDKDKDFKALRGGSWNFDADDARVSIRDGINPVVRDDYVGFRLTQTL